MWCFLRPRSHKWLLFSVKLLFVLCSHCRNSFLVNRPVNGTPSVITCNWGSPNLMNSLAARKIRYLWCLWQPWIFFYPCFLMRDCKKSLFRLFLLETEQYQSVTANYHCLVFMICYYVNKIALTASEIKIKKPVRFRVFPLCSRAFAADPWPAKEWWKDCSFVGQHFHFIESSKQPEMSFASPPVLLISPTAPLVHGISWAVR